jgi:two-component sensor histidine kinase
MPMGFVVNELVTNAIKHAFPPPCAGEIVVALATDDGFYALTVSDSGAGLPASTGIKETGLGMRLVRAFVGQVGGTIAIRHLPGVEYSIRFPATTHGGAG